MNTKSNPSKNMYVMGAKLLAKEFTSVKTEHNFMDLFGYNLEGDSCEIEIKVNDYDFYKEFTKPCKRFKHLAYKYHAKKDHGFCPTRFYFMVPINFAGRAEDRIEKEYPKYGLIVYSLKRDVAIIVRKAKRLHERGYTGEKLKHPFDKYLKHFRDVEKEMKK